MSQRRQTERIFIRVPLRVQGIDQLGKPFKEKTATVVINRDGGRIGLRSVPRFGSRLEITNLSNNATAFFDVTSQCPQSYSGTPEWGVELANPVADFWGIAFQGKKAGEGPVVSALLACNGCGARELSILSSAQYEALGSAFVLSRPCSACGKATVWEVAAAEEDTTAAEPGAAAWEGSEGTLPAEPGPERRHTKRLTLKVPVLVGTASGASETTETENLSKEGLSFLCNLDFSQGEEIQVTVGYGVDPSASARTCHVVWRKPVAKSSRYLYGVRVSESD